jgi:hypothetical protein
VAAENGSASVISQIKARVGNASIVFCSERSIDIGDTLVFMGSSQRFEV